MDVINAIKQRRSVRKYKEKHVCKEMLMDIVECGRLAPTGSNSQPQKFMIVDDKKTISKLRKDEIFPQEFVCTAPALIICAYDSSVYGNKGGAFYDSNEIRAVRDLSIASGFMVLRAEELGLGTCYVGLMDKEKVKEVLDIPNEYTVLYAITVGYSDQEPNEHKRNPIEEYII